MIGRQLGHYRVEAPLGKGGMGEVWLALDLRLEREVALKILPPEDGLDERRRKRFLREARLASSLNHPNIVAIYDVGQTGGFDYIAMERVRGETLRERLQRGKLGVGATREIVQQVLSALRAAHAAGISHRDLKPSNVMVTETSIVKVLDFGLAQQEEAVTGDETRTQLTAVGAVLGTYGYMAPEQYLGERSDARSDVFSLGVLWFELLSGESAFRGATRSEQMRAMLSEGAREIRDVVKEVGEQEAAILMRCLATKAENRYRDAGELLAALESLREPAKRRVWQVAAAAVLVLALAGGMVYRQGQNAAPAASAVTGDLERARTALERYDVPGRIETAVAEAEAALARDAKSAAAYQVLALAKVLEHYVKRDPLLLKQAEGFARRAVELNQFLGSAHGVLGWALSLAGRLEEAEKPLRQGLELNPKSEHAHLGLAFWEAKRQRADAAEKHYQAAEAIRPQLWYVHAMAGSHYYAQGEYEKARVSFEKGREFAPDNVRVLNSLASAYHQLGRDEDAIATLQRAIELRPTGTMYTNLGTLLFFRGQYDRALVAMEKAVELDPGDGPKWGNLADTLRWVPGRRRDSVEAYRTAIRLVEEKLAKAPEDPEWLGFLALYRVKSGEREGAREVVERLAARKGLAPEARYAVGVTAELLGQRGMAVEWIGSAVEKGYSLEEVRNDPELAGLRADVNFRRMESRLIAARKEN
jgi:serine/threonine-protein kinase